MPRLRRYDDGNGRGAHLVRTFNAGNMQKASIKAPTRSQLPKAERTVYHYFDDILAGADFSFAVRDRKQEQEDDETIQRLQQALSIWLPAKLA